MSQALDPIPQSDPLIDPSGRMGERWYRWLSLVVTRLLSAVLTVASTHRTGLSASISATTIYTPTQPATFEVSWAARVSTAASTSSSIAVTVSWTQGGIACSKAFSAQTGNTTATVDGSAIPIRPDSGQPVQYATTYASVGATAMVYALDVVVRQLT